MRDLSGNEDNHQLTFRALCRHGESSWAQEAMAPVTFR
jgi:hypothetical protein